MKQFKGQSKRDLEVSQDEALNNCDDKLDNLQCILTSLESLRKCRQSFQQVSQLPGQKELLSAPQTSDSYQNNNPIDILSRNNDPSGSLSTWNHYLARPCLDLTQSLILKLKAPQNNLPECRLSESNSDSASSISNFSNSSFNLICENSSQRTSPNLNVETESLSDHLVDEETIIQFRKRIDRLRKLTLIQRQLLNRADLLSPPGIPKKKPRKRFSLKLYSRRRCMTNRKIFLQKCEKYNYRRYPPKIIITRMGYVRRKRYLLVCRVRTYPPITYVTHFMKISKMPKQLSFNKYLREMMCYASKSFNNFVLKYMKVITVLTICYTLMMDNTKVVPIDDVGYEAIHLKFLDKVEKLGLPYYQLNGFYIPENDNYTYYQE